MAQQHAAENPFLEDNFDKVRTGDRFTVCGVDPGWSNVGLAVGQAEVVYNERDGHSLVVHVDLENTHAYALTDTFAQLQYGEEVTLVLQMEHLLRQANAHKWLNSATRVGVEKSYGSTPLARKLVAFVQCFTAVLVRGCMNKNVHCQSPATVHQRLKIPKDNGTKKKAGVVGWVKQRWSGSGCPSNDHVCDALAQIAYILSVEFRLDAVNHIRFQAAAPLQVVEPREQPRQQEPEPVAEEEPPAAGNA